MQKAMLVLLVLVGVLGSAVWAADAPEQPAPVKKVNSTDGAEMVLIPAGKFLMGTPSKEMNANNKSECPQHTVMLDDYWIYVTAVSVAQYRKFCEATGRQMPSLPLGGGRDSYPVTNVSWLDAQAYATWAHAKLPTEAQWEKAARGVDGRLWPWGNNAGRAPEDIYGTAGSALHECGSFPLEASPYGMLDAVGNAWEWCADWYDPNYYSTSPATNPPGPATGTTRVIRGGFSTGYFGTTATIGIGSVGCAVRNSNTPTSGGQLNRLVGKVLCNGFRCVVASETKSSPAAPAGASSTKKTDAHHATGK